MNNRTELRHFLTASALSAVLASTAQAQDPLHAVPIPLPPNIGDIVFDSDAAVALGKALFWDEQVGGDGQIAAATCHHSAGADHRTTNTMHPGPDGVFDNVAPGGTLTAANFPIRGDDIVGSQGIVRGQFLGLNIADPTGADQSSPLPGGPFFPNRQVTGRNTPTQITAIFNVDNFWDGRANMNFNGVTPGGNFVGQPPILVDDGAGMLVEVMDNCAPASMASQAVGPPNNEVEMAFLGRSFALLGRKMLGKMPLGLQQVAGDDSSLGVYSNAPANGLSVSYQDLIQAAFNPRYWDSAALTAEGFNQTEANFSLFWGIAVMMYDATLIPDQSPFDSWAAGDNGAMTPSQIRGFDLADSSDARCVKCHDGAETTAASFNEDPEGGGRAFTNTNVTLTAADPGRRRGKFKTSSLRNIELTGPYFHNGRYLTLRQTVDFYDRGGDVDNKRANSQVRRLRLSEQEKVDLVNWMLALTDERVRLEQAPFDRPSLSPPNGAPQTAVGAGGRPFAERVRPFLNADHHTQ